VEKRSHLVYIAQDYEEFCKKINQVVEQDNVELKKQRQEKIKEYDWTIKINQIIELIKKNV